MTVIHYQEMVLGDFLKELSSRAATPGGGAAAGLSAALGASLGAMVAALSQGPRFASVDGLMKGLEERFLESRDRCLTFADQDSAAFQRWVAASRMPSGDPVARKEALEAAMEESCRLPMVLGGEISRLEDALATLQKQGNVRLLSDVGAALALLAAALEISILNLRINQQEISDPALQEELQESVASFDCACLRMRERAFQIRLRLEGQE